MNLIFLGAGASHGSDIANTPPLGNRLFDELADFDPQCWGKLPQEWQEEFREDFEAAMLGFLTQGFFGAPLQWKMAEYFFKRFIISPTNIYIKLLSMIRRSLQEFSIATLNYDTLLFQAAVRANVSLAVGSPENDQDKLSLCLPHGSSILCCEGIKGSSGVSYSYGVGTGGRVRIFRDNADFDNEMATNVFPPVMSYFEPNKHTVSCSNYIKSQREIFKDWVGSAAAIAIVGVNVRPIDSHIWEPISLTKAHILYIGGMEGGGTFKTWATNQNLEHYSIIPDYFAEGISELKDFFNL